LVFSNYFDELMLQIIFKNKKYYFNIFKQQLSNIQKLIRGIEKQCPQEGKRIFPGVMAIN